MLACRLCLIHIISLLGRYTCIPCKDGSECVRADDYCDDHYDCYDDSDEDPKVCEGTVISMAFTFN